MRREDRAEAEAFWRWLDFEPVTAGTLPEVSAWLKTRRHADPPPVEREARGGPEGHAAVVVDDYDAVVAQLRAEGYDVEDRAQQWGVPAASCGRRADTESS